MKIELTINEIVNDLYSLAETEGYLTGLSEGLILSKENEKEYHLFMIGLMDKYLPSWKDKIDRKYFKKENNEIDKGLILSSELYKNFQHIFYQLV